MKVYVTTLTIYSEEPFTISDKELGWFIEGTTNGSELLCLQEDKVIDTKVDAVPPELREVIEEEDIEEGE